MIVDVNLQLKLKKNQRLTHFLQLIVASNAYGKKTNSIFIEKWLFLYLSKFELNKVKKAKKRETPEIV